MLYRLEDVWKRYGPKEVLRGVSWQHNPGEKVGLVGRNGAGKTTLFRILLREEEPDKGEVHRASGLTIGVLRQHLDHDVDGTVFEYVEGAFAEVLRIERTMRELEHAMAEPDADHETQMEEYGDLQRAYERADGYTLHAKVERVLFGVGLAKDRWDRQVAVLSGGEKHRAMLARLLLEAPELLLLDEPTNHLDLEGIEFLEEFLGSYDRGYIVISHDRRFLDRCAEKILDLEFGELDEYPGSYERYRALKAEKMAHLEKAWREQQELIEKTKDFIRRNLAGQKTKQAKSRRKMLEKIEVLDRPMEDRTDVVFKLETRKTGGGTALTLEGARIGLTTQDGTERVFLENCDLQLRRGSRLALVGPNGCGKSTLLRVVAGRRSPVAGRVALGYQVSVGYYDQEMRDLNPAKRVIDELWDLDHRRSEGEVRDLLALYDFRGDEVFREVSTLSGGEKGRLSLAKVVFGEDNLLLLDEPTNHLDLDAREALESALEEYDGTIVTVSHDRWYLDRICDQVLLFAGDGRWELLEGSYSDNLGRIRAVREGGVDLPLPPKRPEPKEEAAPPSPAKPEPKPKAPALTPEEKKRRRSERKALETQVAQLESRIAAREGIVKESEAKLCDPTVYADGGKVRPLQEAIARAKADLEKLYWEWNELSGKLEE
jgi:ATP-binding cassette subfamily F protein 3